MIFLCVLSKIETLVLAVSDWLKLIKKSKNKFNFSFITTSEVRKSLESLNHKKASGLDDII